MVAEKVARGDSHWRLALDQLLHQRGLGRHALFFVSDEGEPEVGWTEETSGYVVAEQGHVFYFLFSWSAEQQEGTLTEWESVEPELRWRRSREYVQAKLAVGLSS